MQQQTAKKLHTEFDIIFIGPETPYLDVLAQQEAAVADVLKDGKEKLFIVEHAPIYTAGSSAQATGYLGGNNIPVVQAGRGGQYTYHGPGQRVIYPILDLRKRGRDLRKYITNLQAWLIQTLKEFGIEAFCRDEIGVWVHTPSGEEKIAAIGVRVRKWVAFHGVALNVNPNLEHFKGIIPCGIQTKGVTSMHALGVNATMGAVDTALLKTFGHYFLF